MTMKVEVELIVLLTVFIHVSLTADVHCPVKSTVGMNITGLVVVEKKSSDDYVYFVQSSHSNVTVNCWSLLPDSNNQTGGKINMTATRQKIGRKQLEPRYDSDRSTAQLVVYRKNDVDMWRNLNVTCRHEHEQEDCTINLALINSEKSTHCNVTANSVDCFILPWYQEALKANDMKCTETDNSPMYQFYMYMSSNQSWKECNFSTTEATKDKQLSVEYQNIKCPLDNVEIEEDETIVIRLRQYYKKDTLSTLFGLDDKVEVCDKSTFLGVTDTELVVVGLATTEALILIGSVILLILVIFCLGCMKRKQIEQSLINRTKHTKTFIKEERYSNSSLGTNSDQTYINSTKDGSSKTEYEKFLDGNESVMINDKLNVNSQIRALKYDRKLDITKDSFKLEFILGEGEYGTVYKATATGISGTQGPITVAAKQVKNVFDRCQWLTILDELKILSFLDTHFNLVNLLAANTENIKSHELFLLLEYCPYGNLKKFLIDRRDKFKGSLSNEPGCLESEFNWNLLLTWSYSIAAGMDYLASKNIMHGDLAARNILIGENYSAKISDFGLSKMMYYNEDYKKTERRLIPLAWMAIEYLQTGEFNMTSDVWSFGVTLWEIFSLGNKPYGLVPYEELKKNILEGERLEIPKNLELHPDGFTVFKEIIEPCWREEFNKRPTFSESMNKIAQLLGEEGIELYKKEEEEYLKSKQLSSQGKNQPKKMAPSGYVRLESLDKPSHHSEIYPNILTTSNENLKPGNSPEPGYIELSTMLADSRYPPGNTVHKLSQIPGDPPPGYLKAVIDERGYTHLSGINRHIQNNHELNSLSTTNQSDL